MHPPRPTVTIDGRSYDAAVMRAVVDAGGGGLPPGWMADGMTAEETRDALSALHRDGMIRRDEWDCYHADSPLSRALLFTHLP